MGIFWFGFSTVILLLLVSQWGSPSDSAEGPCSCYTFYTSPKPWTESNKICQQNGGNLVSMETEQEYQFINKTIQSMDERKDNSKNEWYIGLRKRSGVWKWVNNHRMTIKKWQPGEPSGDGDCVVIAKEWPPGYYGFFNDLKCNNHRMFICEYKKATAGLQVCKNKSTFCLTQTTAQTNIVTTTLVTKETTASTTAATTKHSTQTATTTTQKPKTTTKSLPTTHIAFSSSITSNKGPTSLTVGHKTSYPPTNTKNPTTLPESEGLSHSKSPSKKTKKSFSMVIVVIALGVVLAVSLCLLAFVFYWKRRNRECKNEKNNQESSQVKAELDQPSSTNQDPEKGDGIQLFHQNNGESYVTYAVIYNNLTQNSSQNQGNEPAYASIGDGKMIKRRSSSKKKDPNAGIPAGALSDENTRSSTGGGTHNTGALYASVDKSKKKGGARSISEEVTTNNVKKDGQDEKQWPAGQQVVYASVDKSKKSRAGTEDVVYAEVGSKGNTERQQPNQITYAELADFNQSEPQAVVKPSPYQPAEYAVIIGQKQKS